jgi:branched-chain amino acid aminotransferase
MAKSGANYMNSQLIKMEALVNGFAEGIALDDRGYVSEGSGENIFVVSNGIVNTPPLSSSVLPGITRDSVLQICGELGLTTKERSIQRAALYVADELFFSGTAAEITPIRSVDRIDIGNGQRGEITEKIQKVFFDITSGERPAPGPWLTYVREQKARAADLPTAGAAENGRKARSKSRGEPPTPAMEAELVARARAVAAE